MPLRRSPLEIEAMESGLRLRRFLRMMREGWPILLIGTVLGVVASVTALRLVIPQYTAVMVIGPTARVGAAAMGARLPVLIGRETAAAASEPGPGDEILSDFARYLQLFTSIPVAERMMADPALLRGLFPDRWSEETGGWRPAPGPVASAKRLFLALVGRSDWVEPDAERVTSALRDRLTVDMVGSGPMRRLRLRHPDRAMALRILSAAAQATDAHLRAEASRRTAAQIAHVRARLAGITVAEHRRALADLLSEQERIAMMIEVDLPLAADAIEPPAAAQRPDWPNPLTVVPVAALVGLVAGALVVSLRRLWQAGGEATP
ncbi:hypothetical protein D9623_08165 [Azospirillum brasilense]|uniref:Uncharacterized protein n=3 Tax=Azospirillum brasilense TaxID=192 RepID=A0A0P0F7L0_AZOBR|nr:hypothetical protein AMK58_07140 [Azospirillum brasilense]NUB24234.1 hypothetical protein [Azospirillum brasilense]NUB31237.1 hypothetical protein [Azospirillum brasilense]QCO07801.1 hypothetical protein D3868_01310 [Azospirillum brasilense]QEL90063.1 hypothetical protein D9621_07910 [Azospirillum brasilense]